MSAWGRSEGAPGRPDRRPWRIRGASTLQQSAHLGPRKPVVTLGPRQSRLERGRRTPPARSPFMGERLRTSSRAARSLVPSFREQRQVGSSQEGLPAQRLIASSSGGGSSWPLRTRQGGGAARRIIHWTEGIHHRRSAFSASARAAGSYRSVEASSAPRASRAELYAGSASPLRMAEPRRGVASLGLADPFGRLIRHPEASCPVDAAPRWTALGGPRLAEDKPEVAVGIGVVALRDDLAVATPLGGFSMSCKAMQSRSGLASRNSAQADRLAVGVRPWGGSPGPAGRPSRSGPGRRSVVGYRLRRGSGDNSRRLRASAGPIGPPGRCRGCADRRVSAPADLLSKAIRPHARRAGASG